MRCTALVCYGLLESGIFLTIGGHAVGVNRVVVVQGAVCVHVANIVSVARVRRAKPKRL